MPILRKGVVSEDAWIDVDDKEPLPSADAIIVGLHRWLSEREILLTRKTALGVRVEPGDDVAQLAKDLSRLDLIAIIFPRFRDGRGFSYGRILRERFGFKGELRAVGDILRDQLLFLDRCGFDAIEVKGDKPIQDWLAAIGEFTVWYQPTADGRASILKRRHP
jgi:uncharacterized protein (DUF934 family)